MAGRGRRVLGLPLEEGDTAVLVDCGNGVFGKLRQRIDYVDVDAVLISHLHADHFLDLVPYAYALSYAPRQQPVAVNGWPGTDNPARPVLHAPPGARQVFRRVVGAWGNEDLIEKAFALDEYNPENEIEVGSLRVRFQPVPHFTETYAMAFSSASSATQPSAGSGRLVYAADCSPTTALNGFASQAELMLVEATLPRPERTGSRGHLTPGEAGEQARAAGAKRLLLVHISDELDAGWAREAGGGLLRRARGRRARGRRLRGVAEQLGHLAAAAVQAAHDRALAGAEGLGRLLVAEAGQVHGGDGLAVGLGQLGHRAQHLARGEDGLRRVARTLVGELLVLAQLGGARPAGLGAVARVEGVAQHAEQVAEVVVGAQQPRLASTWR